MTSKVVLRRYRSSPSAVGSFADGDLPGNFGDKLPGYNGNIRRIFRRKLQSRSHRIRSIHEPLHEGDEKCKIELSPGNLSKRVDESKAAILLIK